MRLIDIFRLSTRMFKTNRLRTVLTILGISVGIGAILFLVSFGFGLQNILLDQIATSLLSIDVKPADASSLIKLDKDHVRQIESLKAVFKTSPVFEVNSLMKIGDLNGIVSGVLTKASFFDMEGIKTLRGGFYAGDTENKIVVSTATLLLFNLSPDEAIGKKARFEFYMPKTASEGEFLETIEETETKIIDKTYEIIAVVDDSSKSYVYIPMDSVNSPAGELNISYYTQLKVNAKEQKDVAEVKKEIEYMGFKATAVADTVTDADRIFQAIQIILSAFGAVALIVSAIGMFNTMTIALLERTQEIGIMKALGASRRDIWKLFLAESVIIGFLGGAFGILFGFLGARAVNMGVNALAKSYGGQQVTLFITPAIFILFIIVFSTTVGLVTGLYPAKRASRLNPLEALRYK